MSSTDSLLRACVEVGGKAQLARLIGVSPTYLAQMAGGERPIAIPHCPSIERATNGAVMRWDLRPDDWWHIWPELTERPDSPSIPETSAA